MIEKEELETIIPHRGKMMLLSRITGYDLKERSLCADYHVTKDCLFYDPQAGGVPSWVAFEFMAQAISSLTGITDRELGIKPGLGFILSVPYMRMDLPLFKLDSRVEVRVKEIDRTGLFYTFTGEAFMEGKKAMEGKLIVMEANEEFNTLV